MDLLAQFGNPGQDALGWSLDLLVQFRNLGQVWEVRLHSESVFKHDARSGLGSAFLYSSCDKALHPADTGGSSLQMDGRTDAHLMG